MPSMSGVGSAISGGLSQAALALAAAKSAYLKGGLTGEIIIAGETVVLEEDDDIIPYSAVVSFSQKYFPPYLAKFEDEVKEMNTAKRAFSTVFSKTVDISNPLPDCKPYGKEIINLVTQGIRNRFETLREEIQVVSRQKAPKEGEDVPADSESIVLVSLLEKLGRFKILLRQLELQRKSCPNQSNAELEAIETNRLLIQNEEYYKLIRYMTYAFLQDKYGLEGTELPAIVKETMEGIKNSNNPMTAENLSEYTQEWIKQSDTPFPSGVSSVMKATQRGGGLRGLAKRVYENGVVELPGDMAPQKFEMLFAKLPADSHDSDDKNICFLNYFISMAVKQLFLSHKDKGTRMMKKIDNIIENVIEDLKSPKNMVFAPGEKDQQIIYSILTVVFSLLYAAMGAGDSTGLTVICRDYPDRQANEIIASIHKYFRKAKRGSRESFAKGLITMPAIAFHARLMEESEDPNLLSQFPSFAPIGEAAPKDFTELQILNDFKKKVHPIPDSLQEDAKYVVGDSTLDYGSLFLFFVLLGRQYLIETDEMLTEKGCPVPEFM